MGFFNQIGLIGSGVAPNKPLSADPSSSILSARLVGNRG